MKDANRSFTYGSAANWNLLSAFGVPLLGRRCGISAPDVTRLLRELQIAARELTRESKDVQWERKLESVQAFLLALKLQFPTFYRNHVAGLRLPAALVPPKPSGRVIKLNRLAGRALSEYL